MKRIISFIIVLCMTTLFVSCNKEGETTNNNYTEGVYHPSKRIIRSESTGMFGTEITRYVWGTRNLEKIIRIDGQVVNLSYDKKDRIVQIYYRDLDEYMEYIYDGNKLKEINYYSNVHYDGELLETCTFTYTNGKITKIESLDIYGHKKDRKERGVDVLQLIMGKEMATLMKDGNPNYRAQSGSKGSSKTTYELTWNNDNVTRIDVTYDDPSWSNCTIKAEYDNYNNPFYGYPLEGNDSDISSLSKNNMTSYSYERGQLVWTRNYVLTYEGGYPTSRHYYVEEESEEGEHWVEDYYTEYFYSN